MANKALRQAIGRGGRSALAMNCVLAGSEGSDVDHDDGVTRHRG